MSCSDVSGRVAHVFVGENVAGSRRSDRIIAASGLGFEGFSSSAGSRWDDRPDEKTTMSKPAEQQTLERPIDVLVVDDEPMVRDFIARVLRRNGFTCRAVSDAGEAIATATDDPPHLAISDIRMPGKDGTWLLVELRKRWPDLPVIMLTAVSEAEQAVVCLKAGAQDYLVKPIDVDALLAAVWQGAEKARLAIVADRAPSAENAT
jgi:CheY-like chemotaxis protein